VGLKNFNIVMPSSKILKREGKDGNRWYIKRLGYVTELRMNVEGGENRVSEGEVCRNYSTLCCPAFLGVWGQGGSS